MDYLFSVHNIPTNIITEVSILILIWFQCELFIQDRNGFVHIAINDEYTLRAFVIVGKYVLIIRSRAVVVYSSGCAKSWGRWRSTARYAVHPCEARLFARRPRRTHVVYIPAAGDSLTTSSSPPLDVDRRPLRFKSNSRSHRVYRGKGSDSMVANLRSSTRGKEGVSLRGLGSRRTPLMRYS